MPFTDSGRKQFTAVVPTNPTLPTIPEHLQTIVDAIEAKVVLTASDWAYADTFLTPYVPGMLVYIDNETALFLRVGAAWRKLSPTNYSGTGDPDPGLGSDGDLYFKTS